MTAIGFSIDLQGAQIAASLLGVSSLLADEMASAMTDIETTLAEDAVSNQHWIDGNGDLEDSTLEDSTSSTWSAKIGSDLPYNRRRDWGFSGMTDSLGRYYPFDPGAFFLDDALDNNIDYIEQRIQQAVQRMFFGIAAST